VTFLTGLALRRRPVTILVIILVLVAGVVTYGNLQRELFPDIEFPNITIITVYPNGNPEAVERDVTKPIEEAVDGISGLKEIQSTSSENVSLVLLTFEFGEDMEEAERTITGNINSIDFPAGVESPTVSRINNNTFPVIQLSVTGDRDIPSLQRIVDNAIVPQIERIEGVFSATVLGEVEEQIVVTVDSQRLEDLGLTMQQVSNAISSNNASFPAGTIDRDGSSFPIRATHRFGSLDDIRNLTIGFERELNSGAPAGVAASPRIDRPILLEDVATVELSTDSASSISRTNGRPSLSIVVVKEPDANTVDVTSQTIAALDSITGLPDDIQVLIMQNDGPEVERQLSNLVETGFLGFLFAVSVVFLFLVHARPSLLRGMAVTLRPTAIIGVSIPLSIMTGILVMGLFDLSLNFMSLAGLAIAVGRVVDDSIVVLENMYRHMQMGEDRFQSAVDGAREVGAAIVSSTLTTVAVFIPLAFIPGLVGEFFTPFAMAVSFALLASTLVALTAVPVLGVVLLREGDFPEDQAPGAGVRDTLLQRIYTPVLVWTLRHKLATLAGSGGVVAASLALLLIIPVTFFPAGTPQFLLIDLEMPTGTGVGRTFEEVARVEAALEEFNRQGHVEVYQVTLGGTSTGFGPVAGGGGFHQAAFFVKLAEDVPEDIAHRVRAAMPGSGEAEITVTEISAGPPEDALEITVTGQNFTDISAVARELVQRLGGIDGIINVNTDVAEARNEVTINIDPRAAAEYGLTSAEVGRQVNQFVVGSRVSEVDLENLTLDIVVRGHPDDVRDIDLLQNVRIQGNPGAVRLGALSNITIEPGPVTISRFNLERSATISGEITAQDTQAIGRLVADQIAEMDLPPGVDIKTGGIFQQIEEGFQDIFTAMLVGVILVYLVMVASLGSLRDPFIVVLSLPLAIVGALAALAITDRSLSLSAMMGLLLLIGVVVTNAIVLITFVEQLRQRGFGVYDALIEAGRTRVRPILMTACTTIIALAPLAVRPTDDGGIIGAELATVVIGGLVSSTFLTLIAVPVIYTIFHVNIPNAFDNVGAVVSRVLFTRPAAAADSPESGD
jgi:hydrophobic/amphiphilic exporter-1 (mainly G- bacteria), HAE1 family